MTNPPLSRLARPAVPTRPVFPRQSAAPEELLLPAAAAVDNLSPSSQIQSLFDAPAPPRRRQTRASFSPTLSVGQQFLHARLAHGWTIEDVAFQTHIPHTLLREMENDDLSNFANLTYAKGFLKLYSRHLEIDLSDYLEQFDTSAISDVTGHEYIQTASLVRSLSAPAIAPDAVGNPRIRLLGIGILTGVAAILLFVFLKFSHSTPDPSPSRSDRGPAGGPAVSESVTRPRAIVADAGGKNVSGDGSSPGALRRGVPSRQAVTIPPALKAPPRAEIIPDQSASVPMAASSRL
ncbi:MAG: helix-turn-helix domain-containing protein [Verrucomicrobiota bacterium]